MTIIILMRVGGSPTPFIHTSCETCIQREFARKTRGAFRCPACLKQGKERDVLKQSLETKTLEQLLVGGLLIV